MRIYGSKWRSRREDKYTSLLGGQIGCSGNLNGDLHLRMRKRFCAVNKIYNFLRSNKLASIPVSCVFA